MFWKVRRINNSRLAAIIGLALLISVSATAVVKAATATTTVSSDIQAAISISSNGTVNDNIVPSGPGAQSIQSDTVTVSTNDVSGYTLGIAETGVSSSLTFLGNTIPATSGTWSAPTTMAVNTWGYRVDGTGSFSGGTTSAQSSTAISGSINFAAVPATASPQTIKSTSTTATNDPTTIWYGVAANTSQPPGTYTNSITYTATSN